MEPHSYGKSIIILGIILVVIGLIFVYIKDIPFIGKLPVDVYIKKKNFTFYFPITTSIIVSILITLILYFFKRK